MALESTPTATVLGSAVVDQGAACVFPLRAMMRQGSDPVENELHVWLPPRDRILLRLGGGATDACVANINGRRSSRQGKNALVRPIRLGRWSARGKRWSVAGNTSSEATIKIDLGRHLGDIWVRVPKSIRATLRVNGDWPRWVSEGLARVLRTGKSDVSLRWRDAFGIAQEIRIESRLIQPLHRARS
jgi:hypothetical protein